MRITFTKSKLSYGWLGNMAPYEVIYGKVWQVWRTTEALFQAMRFSDEAIKSEIRRARSPMTAKMIAKRNAEHMVVQPRSSVDVANMVTVLKLKTAQHPLLGHLLVETADAVLTEDVTKRPRSESSLFWGAALENGAWIGQNMLGELWMQLRSELRSELK